MWGVNFDTFILRFGLVLQKRNKYRIYRLFDKFFTYIMLKITMLKPAKIFFIENVQ